MAGKVKSCITPQLAEVTMVAVALLLLAAAPQEAEGARAASSLTSRSLSGLAADDRRMEEAASRTPEQANKYTRGCNPIHQCRG
ncbi:hypothetical protein ACP4OV_022090 [Aristida adscensionis]